MRLIKTFEGIVYEEYGNPNEDDYSIEIIYDVKNEKVEEK